MNTQETLERLVKIYEERLKDTLFVPSNEMVSAYCLAVMARSMTR